MARNTAPRIVIHSVLSLRVPPLVPQTRIVGVRSSPSQSRSCRVIREPKRLPFSAGNQVAWCGTSRNELHGVVTLTLQTPQRVVASLRQTRRSRPFPNDRGCVRPPWEVLPRSAPIAEIVPWTQRQTTSTNLGIPITAGIQIRVHQLNYLRHLQHVQKPGKRLEI